MRGGGTKKEEGGGMKEGETNSGEDSTWGTDRSRKGV